jgi:hypothetical protein
MHRYVQAPFWTAVVAESTVMYQHRCKICPNLTSLALSPPYAAERRWIILADGREGAKSDAGAMYIVLSFKPLSTDISHLRYIRSLEDIRRGFWREKELRNIYSRKYIGNLWGIVHLTNSWHKIQKTTSNYSGPNRNIVPARSDLIQICNRI